MKTKKQVYLNGTLVAQDEAVISVNDRGFLFADSLYEVIPAFNGKCFQAEKHLQRLKQSCAEFGIAFPSACDNADVCEHLLKCNNLTAGAAKIYIQVTRGAPAIRDHKTNHSKNEYNATCYISAEALKENCKETLKKGYKAITVDDNRPNITRHKTTALCQNIQALHQNPNADEIIWCMNNKILEGCHSNVFIVKNGIIKTPSTNAPLLNGVTRELIIKCARECSIPVMETDIALEELTTADEIWCCGSTKEIWPITELNKKAVGNGKAGEYWERIYAAYQSMKKKYARPTKRAYKLTIKLK